LGPLHDLDCPFPELPGPARKRVAAVARVRKDLPHLPQRALAPHQGQRRPGAVAVLTVCHMDHRGKQHPQSVHDDVPLAACHLLAAIIAAGPPFSVVLTLWLSMMPTEGSIFLPAACRTCPRNLS